MAITLKKNPSDKKLATIVQRIKGRNAAHDIAKETYFTNTGKDLLQAKALLKHGEWLPWLMVNFNWTARTAQSYMKVAKLAEKHPEVTSLKPAAVAALAAPSTPDVVKSEVIADLEKGNVPTPKEVKAKIAAAKISTKEKVAALVAKGSAQFAAMIDEKIEAKAQAVVDLDLVERLKGMGLDDTIMAVSKAFPNVLLTVELINVDMTVEGEANA
jgi:hypothetical protein